MISLKMTKMILISLFLAMFAQAIYSDGFIVIPDGKIFPPPGPRPIPPVSWPFPLEVVFHKVNVNIEGQAAVTSIDQEFYNPTAHRLEGYYLFPLPVNAVIKKFSMFIDGKEMPAELLDAQKARQIYEDIVRRQKDPALLEYAGQGVFKARIFPIEPFSKKRVKISYSEILSKDNRTIEYLYPLNTEKFSAKPLKNVSIEVTIESQENIKNIYCPTHKVDITRKGSQRAVIGYEENEVKPDRDFKLYYSTDNEKLGFSLLSYKKGNEDGYFFLSLSPGFEAKEDEIAEKDIAFVLDVSGSMAGEKLKQAKKALLFCIENLNKGDRFEIIRFSTEAEALFRGFAPVTEENLKQAREFIDRLQAIGGTNIEEALTLAMDMKKQAGRPTMVVFLTDGKPTIGETDENRLLQKIETKNTSNLRIFTFGIGNDINTHLLDKITEMTRAFRSYISPEQDIEVEVSNFYAKVQSPILTDIALSYGKGIKVSKTYPNHLPDLFKGSSITILGRYQGHGDAEVTLTGRLKDKERKFGFSAAGGFVSGDAKESEKNDFIPSLWAARRVGYLLDQIRLHGEDKELVEEITQLARTYGIITPYTSYLILEDEQNNVRRGTIRDEDQTLGQIAREDEHFAGRSREEYGNLSKKSGAPSVQASKEMQSLNVADSFDQSRQGGSRLEFKDYEGKARNLAQEVKNIQGRAVYNTGKIWVDSYVQKQKNQQVQRIQFASTGYFDLLKKEPLSAQFLALGKNIRFVLNNVIYEIYE